VTEEQPTIRNDVAYLYTSTDTKERVRELKRGGETFDGLLRRISRDYDPSVEAGRARRARETHNGE